MTRVRVHFMDSRLMEFETSDYDDLLRTIKDAAPRLGDGPVMYFEGEGGPAFRVDQVLWIEAIKVVTT